jgi:hypothetical protein
MGRCCCRWRACSCRGGSEDHKLISQTKRSLFVRWGFSIILGLNLRHLYITSNRLQPNVFLRSEDRADFDSMKLETQAYCSPFPKLVQVRARLLQSQVVGIFGL